MCRFLRRVVIQVWASLANDWLLRSYTLFGLLVSLLAHHKFVWQSNVEFVCLCGFYARGVVSNAREHASFGCGFLHPPSVRAVVFHQYVDCIKINFTWWWNKTVSAMTAKFHKLAVTIKIVIRNSIYCKCERWTFSFPSLREFFATILRVRSCLGMKRFVFHWFASLLNFLNVVE